MVVLKVNGKELSRAMLSNSYHAVSVVDKFYTAELDTEGHQSYKSNTMRFERPVSSLTSGTDTD
jgi:hypothetical protein